MSSEPVVPLESAGDSNSQYASQPPPQNNYMPPPQMPSQPPPLPTKAPPPANVYAQQPAAPLDSAANSSAPYSDQPLSSSGQPDYRQQPQLPSQQAIQQQVEELKTEEAQDCWSRFKACCISRPMKILVKITIFIVCLLLIGIGGALNAIFIFTGVNKAFPEFLFLIYSVFDYFFYYIIIN